MRSHTGISVLCCLIFTDKLLADVNDTELSKFLLTHTAWQDTFIASSPGLPIILFFNAYSTENWREEAWEIFIHVNDVDIYLRRVGRHWEGGRLNDLEDSSSSVCSKGRINLQPEKVLLIIRDEEHVHKT